MKEIDHIFDTYEYLCMSNVFLALAAKIYLSQLFIISNQEMCKIPRLPFPRVLSLQKHPESFLQI